METRHYLFIIGFVIWLPLAVGALSLHRRVAQVMLFVFVFGTLRHDAFHLQLSFFDHSWYRGTSVGYDLSWVDFLWPALWIDDVRRHGLSSKTPKTLLLQWIFLLWCTVSVVMQEPRLFGTFELFRMLRGLGVFVTIARCVRSLEDVTTVCWAFAAIGIVEGGAALYTRSVLRHPRAEGTFLHPNTLSLYCLMVLPVTIGVWLSDARKALRSASAAAALGLVLGVLVTVSRAGLATLGLELIGMMFAFGSLRFTWRKVVVGSLALVISLGAAWKLAGAYAARFEREGGLAREFENEDNSGRGRYYTLAMMMAADHPWGVGLNNWSYVVTNRYGLAIGLVYAPYVGVDERPPVRRVENVDNQQAPPAHSLSAITLGETGWLGLGLLALLWYGYFSMGAAFLRGRTSALVSRVGVGVFFSVFAAFMQSISEWELRQTPLVLISMILFAIAAALHPARQASSAQAA
ncbi:MAG: hypothetical protein JST92_06930 [Deltaproteobacteria bacterium]|nr:hypothetical protein [Deltaproteobacteria bacterium]